MTIDEARTFIAAHRWQTSKDGSHQYTVKDWPGCDCAAFLAVAGWIRDPAAGGYFDRWGGHRYRYMDIDGMQYWTMGWPLAQTQVLNRARKGTRTASRTPVCSSWRSTSSSGRS